MKLNLKLTFTDTIELWLAHSFLVISIFLLFDSLANPHLHYAYEHQLSREFASAHLRYDPVLDNFLPKLLRYLTLYGCFLLLNFKVVKNLRSGINVKRNIIYVVLLYLLSVTAYAVSDMVMKKFVFNGSNTLFITKVFFKIAFLHVLLLYTAYGVYVLKKHIIRFIIKRYNLKLRLSAIAKDCIILFIIWLVVFFVLNASRLPDDYRIYWIISGIPGISLYACSLAIIIPKLKNRGKGFWNYFLKVLLISVITSVLLVLVHNTLFDIRSNWMPSFTTPFICITTQLFTVAPLTWWIYHYRAARSKEISGLQTSLGQTSADLNFLRSQINPHFLFNALNTLYATALQENAERTGEGIQKLGDMMRFMLHENVQEKTSLLSEVEYLNNYIALQKLRTQTSEDIEINVTIQDDLPDHQITPMLLIPFVENAFKHGISLREYSYIKIALRVENDTLFFEVNNSVHTRSNIDPEQDKSGIGLENVKQRLQLLYPGRHELSISQSDQVFSTQLILNIAN